VIVPGATHLFEEPGALDQVALLACDWFERNLAQKEVPTKAEEKA
jgi:putative phosphoribosyl transferase